MALGIEAAGAEDRHQLLADVALERLERRAQQVVAAGAVLVALGRRAGLARRADHEHQRRIVRRLWPAIAADMAGARQRDRREIATGTIDPLHPPLGERSEEHTSELQSLMRI